jgi:hypothetical protein
MADDNSIASNQLRFIHFGDLHIREASDETTTIFQDLIEEANEQFQ